MKKACHRQKDCHHSLARRAEQHSKPRASYINMIKVSKKSCCSTLIRPSSISHPWQSAVTHVLACLKYAPHKMCDCIQFSSSVDPCKCFGLGVAQLGIHKPNVFSHLVHTGITVNRQCLQFLQSDLGRHQLRIAAGHGTGVDISSLCTCCATAFLGATSFEFAALAELQVRHSDLID